jgi:FKBP-type peptidyl-prolyl cis-trans isomerase FkpA
MSARQGAKVPPPCSRLVADSRREKADWRFAMTKRTLLTVMLSMGLILGCQASESPDDEGETSGPPTELMVQILREGEGEALEVGQTAQMHYVGWLYDETAADNKGRQFDSSRIRGVPIPFTLGERRVIAGWELGSEGMQVGEQRRLIIPPDLAYGDRGYADAIPPGATLVFDIELMGID